MKTKHDLNTDNLNVSVVSHAPVQVSRKLPTIPVPKFDGDLSS